MSLSVAVLAMACFFTWFSHKRREIPSEYEAYRDLLYNKTGKNR